jgi:hypothetical protein
LNDFVRVAENERIYAAESDSNLKLARAVILDFFSRNCHAPFGVVFDPVKNLLFTILFKSGMLPSMFRWIYPMLECRFQATSWPFECSRRHIDRPWNIALRFCDIANKGDLLASEFHFFEKSRFFGGYYGELLGYNFRRGVARGFRVVAQALWPFRATLSPVESDGISVIFYISTI